MSYPKPLQNKKGERVPGVTKVLGTLGAPFLMAWANKIGLSGIDLRSFQKEAGETGTQIHDAIEAHLTGNPPTVFPSETVKLSYEKFLSWYSTRPLKLLSKELTLVSEANQYGGRIDLYCSLNEHFLAVELKTSKDIFLSHKLQAVANAALLIENGYNVTHIAVSTFPKEVELPPLDWIIPVAKAAPYFQVFTDLLRLYYDLAEITRDFV